MNGLDEGLCEEMGLLMARLLNGEVATAIQWTETILRKIDDVTRHRECRRAEIETSASNTPSSSVGGFAVKT